jgi:ubiquinone/menaquinone biosynthesis C-methylase UbiE
VNLAQRAHELEHLDRPALDPEQLDHALAQVYDVNRGLGGDRALRQALRPLLSETAEQRLLDVGVGSAQVALGLARWAGRRGRRWRIVGVDHHAQTARLAGRRVARAASAERAAVAIVHGDGLRLPFPDRSFDAAFSVLTLHHLRDEAAVTLVREMARVARRVVVVNDLERSRPALLGAQLLAATVWRGSPITRHDGPLSVRRAFTPAELLAIGERAGLGRARVRRHPAFRLVLEGHP